MLNTDMLKSEETIFPLKPIGCMHTPYTSVEQIPKGRGAKHEACGYIEIFPEYQEGLIDIDGFSHLYVLWIFHKIEEHKLIVTPPSDNRSHGIFSTRSPYRPNPIGLTVVKLIKRVENRLEVEGVDMLDGSPVIDIKPYLSSIDEKEIRSGWLDAINPK